MSCWPGRPLAAEMYSDRPSSFGAKTNGSLRSQAGLHGGDGAVRNLFRGLIRDGIGAPDLGIVWEKLHDLNPRLIFCSISGYGQAGPLRDVPAIEWAVQAMSGMTAAYVSEDADHRDLGLGVLDPFSGYVAFSAILVALLQRQQTGEGQRIDVAMLDAALMLMSPSVAAHFMGAEGREARLWYRVRSQAVEEH